VTLLLREFFIYRWSYISDSKSLSFISSSSFWFPQICVLINNLQVLSQYTLWLMHTYLLISQLQQTLEFWLTICHFLLAQKKRNFEPTLLWIKIFGTDWMILLVAFHPVQWHGTINLASSLTSSSKVGSIISSYIFSLRWNPPIIAYMLYVPVIFLAYLK